MKKNDAIKLGFDEEKLPKIEYLLRILKEINSTHEFFDPIINKIIIEVPKGIFYLILFIIKKVIFEEDNLMFFL